MYGARWEALRAALLAPPTKVTLSNPFGLADYSLDEASLLPPRYLAPNPGDRVGDFCASPGGKSLAMIFALRGEAAWHLNDLSPARLSRLKAVLHDSLPAEVLARIRFSRGDASQWGRRVPGEFDRILVDAPCSGERHLLATPSELARWSPKAVKGLVVRQNALLCSALDCLKPGAKMVYSTCSIHPDENDGVIARLGRSRPGQFRVLPVEGAPFGAATESGWIVLPDVDAGRGPIYFSIVQKVPIDK